MRGVSHCVISINELPRRPLLLHLIGTKKDAYIHSKPGQLSRYPAAICGIPCHLPYRLSAQRNRSRNKHPLCQPGSTISRKAAVVRSADVKHPFPLISNLVLILMLRLPSGDKSPNNALLERKRLVSLLKLPSSAGIDPLSSLSERMRLNRLLKLPSSAGIDPLSSLFERFRVNRLLKLPSSTGIDPLN